MLHPSSEKIESREAIERQEAVWRILSARKPNPVQQFEWTKACLETLHDNDKKNHIEIMTPTANDAIAPLIRRSKWLPRLTFPGSEELSYPMDFLSASPEALDRLSRAIVSTGLPLKLSLVPGASETPDALRRAYRGKGLVFVRADDSIPALSIDDSWATPEHHMSERQRHNFRRRKRVAERLGEVSFEAHVPDASSVKTLLAEAMAVEARSWKGRCGTALVSEPMVKRFFERYAMLAAQRGLLRIFFLRIGGKAAAMRIGIEHGRHLWLLKTGYDDFFKKCSPGFLLIVECLSYAARRRLSSIEFLGDKAWPDETPQQYRSHVSIRAYPISLKGMALLTYDATSWTARKLMYFLRKQSNNLLRLRFVQAVGSHKSRRSLSLNGQR